MQGIRVVLFRDGTGIDQLFVALDIFGGLVIRCLSLLHRSARHTHRSFRLTQGGLITFRVDLKEHLAFLAESAVPVLLAQKLPRHFRFDGGLFHTPQVPEPRALQRDVLLLQVHHAHGERGHSGCGPGLGSSLLFILLIASCESDYHESCHEDSGCSSMGVHTLRNVFIHPFQHAAHAFLFF